MRDSLRTYLSAELVFYYVLTTAILFGFWQGASWLVQADYLPSPLKVVPRLIEMLGNAELWLALLASLQRLVISFVCALAGGIVVGLAIGRSTLARGLIEPLLALSYPIPKAAVLPIVMLWFGAGDISQVFVIATTATLPIIYHTADGSRRVNQKLIWAANSMGSNSITCLRRVILPATLPDIAAGSRTGIMMGLIVMVTAEMIARTDGVGSLLFVYFDMGQNVDMYALIVLLGIVGLALDRLLAWPLRRLTHWAASR
ncbi:ABC transporter permease [Pusillimonas sp.]|uniref:ABC transporter permease n=1 Tax=Pusillimonas sp. TaxID=3040095 RepID=UPI0037C9698D